MRMKLATAALLIAACLAACGRGGGGGGGTGFLESGPSDADLLRVLQAYHSGHPIVAAKLDQCREETVEGNTVQACGFCFVAVGLNYSEDTISRGAYLRAVRRTGTVSFTRGPAPAEPGAEPQRRPREVWVASKIRHDGTIESAPLTNDMMSRAGHHRRAGVGTFVRWMFQRPSSLGPLGEVAEPVAATFANDEALRSEAADLVGACGRERGEWRGRPQPPANNRSA